MLRSLGGRVLARPLARIEDPRATDFDRGSLIRLAVGPDVAAVLLNDSIAGGEAQASALPEWLGRIERLEQVPLDLVAHPNTRIANCQQHILPGRHAYVLQRLGRQR